MKVTVAVTAFLLLFSTLCFPAQSDTTCLQVMLFHEANTEPLKGQRAVLDVILNRMESEYKTACQVMLTHGAFPWVRSKHKNKGKLGVESLTRLQEMPRMLPSNYFWFHHKNVKPKWSNRMTCKRIASHMFCSEREKK